MHEPVALFDLDDTLIPRRAVFPKWAAEFSDQHSVPLHWLLENDPEYLSRRPAFFELAKTTFGLGPSAEAMHDQYVQRMPELVEPDPEVQALLAGLREERWRLGVVTNGLAQNQMRKVMRAELYDLVDEVVISGAVGVHKPDERIFHHATDQLGVAPGPHVVMIGDNLQDDIEGARLAGLTTVWISHGRPLTRPGPRPQHTARTLAKAVEMLRAIQGRPAGGQAAATAHNRSGRRP
ncbi:HAD family hydrolase [Streptomyces sp. NPDC020799]|uniref:HAD family hydrolase n=1 Tax=Streptomyces sp. NPDC020799 TaxID=3365091 RepID=UPI003484D367